MKKIIFLTPLLILVGCATSNSLNYTVLVDGITNPDTTAGQSFVVAPLNEGIDSSDLQFREFSKYVSRAMIAQGFTEGDNKSNSDITIFLAYGIDDPEERQIAYNRPIYGETGISSKETTGIAYGSSSKLANAIRGSATYSSTTTYTPTYGITGYIPETYTKITFHRYAYLYAEDLTEGVPKENRLRWKLLIASTGSSGDLRSVFPVMIAASQQYLGKNTQGSIKLNISEIDPRVSIIRSQLNVTSQQELP